jgi:hypothetical protein
VGRHRIALCSSAILMSVLIAPTCFSQSHEPSSGSLTLSCDSTKADMLYSGRDCNWGIIQPITHTLHEVYVIDYDKKQLRTREHNYFNGRSHDQNHKYNGTVEFKAKGVSAKEEEIDNEDDSTAITSLDYSYVLKFFLYSKSYRSVNEHCPVSSRLVIQSLCERK